MNVKSENEQKAFIDKCLLQRFYSNRVYLKGTLAVPHSISITAFTHTKKEFLKFKWHQKAFNFYGIKKRRKMDWGGAVPFVKSHMKTELQCVAEKLEILGEKKENKNYV